MKNFIVVSFVLISFLSKAQETQEVSVEKNLYGAQLGLVSSSFYYETKLQRKIALRTEVGLALMGTTVESNDPAIKDKTDYFFLPYLSLEPRWYFGLDRRNRLKRNTYNNSSDFISLNTSFISGKTLFENNNLNPVSAVTIIPKYGMRRVFAKNFNYEFFTGVGYQYNIFSNEKGCNCDHNVVAIDFQVRIGYDF